MQHVLEFVGRGDEMIQAVGGGFCFEIVDVTEEGIEEFTFAGSIIARLAQFFNYATYLFDLRSPLIPVGHSFAVAARQGRVLWRREYH